MAAEGETLNTQSAYCQDLLINAYSKVFLVEKQSIPIGLILELLSLAIQFLPQILKLCGVSGLVHNCERNTLIARIEARRALIQHSLWKRRDNHELLDVLLYSGSHFDQSKWESLRLS